MIAAIGQVGAYTLIPGVVATAGALLTVLRRPSDAVIGAVQHLAAGVIFYAAAGELLPDATHGKRVWPLIAGGLIGIGAMLSLRRYADSARGPAGLLAAAAVDALIDGLALGLGFQVGRHQGLLLAIALAVEFLFLGLAMAGAFGPEAGRGRIVGSTAAVSLMVPVGALSAIAIGGWPAAWRQAAFAFGLTALLYLVTEELLVEAHEKPETAVGTALLFIGFLGLAVLDQSL